MSVAGRSDGFSARRTRFLAKAPGTGVPQEPVTVNVVQNVARSATNLKGLDLIQCLHWWCNHGLCILGLSTQDFEREKWIHTSRQPNPGPSVCAIKRM